MGKFAQYPRSSKVGFVVGVALVAFGLFRLMTSSGAPVWWTTFVKVFDAVLDLIWPIALMAVGGVLLWAGLTGRLESVLKGRFNPPLARSVTDRRLFGVCGGLAQFCLVDATLLRAVFVLFFFVSPWLCLVAYVVLAVLMQRS